MNEPRRFELVLPAELRGRLFALAREIGTGAADLARLAILRLVNERAALTADRRERFAVEQPQISQWEGPQTSADSGGEVLAEVHDLFELHRALRERSEALNLSRNGLDTLAGLETGYSAKDSRRKILLVDFQFSAFFRTMSALPSRQSPLRADAEHVADNQHPDHRHRIGSRARL